MDDFVFDTNVLIDLKMFNPLVFKSLWENICSMISSGNVFSVSEVQSELFKTEDRLHEKWSHIDDNHDFFMDISEKDNSDDYWDAMADLESFEVFQRHGENKPFWADPYLIAVGMVEGTTVVTNETMHRNKKRSIPYVCEKVGVSCITFDEFMIQNGWSW